MTSIEGYENYLIFEDGKIINTKSGREMKPCSSGRYYSIQLCKNNRKKFFTIHRLIAETFIPNPDNKPYIDHINRDKKDNRIENLRWVTSRENSRNINSHSNTGFQFISKCKASDLLQGFYYRFQIQRPEIKKNYCNKELQTIIEFRNKFCAENDIEINDS